MMNGGHIQKGDPDEVIRYFSVSLEEDDYDALIEFCYRHGLRTVAEGAHALIRNMCRVEVIP